MAVGGGEEGAVTFAAYGNQISIYAFSLRPTYGAFSLLCALVEMSCGALEQILHARMRTLLHRLLNGCAAIQHL